MESSSNNRIRVNVRLSSQIARRVGKNRLAVSVDKTATISDVKEEIKRNHPDIEPLLTGTLAVVSGEMVNTNQQVIQGQEIAFLTPAAGG